MTIRLLSPISVAGVAKSIGDIITGDPAWEADQVNANNAVYTHRDLVQGEGLVDAQLLVQDGNVSGLALPDGPVNDGGVNILGFPGADFGAKFNAAIAKYGKERVRYYATGEHTLTTSVDLTNARGLVVDLRGAWIDVVGADLIAFDCTNWMDGHFYWTEITGDATDVPRAAILYADSIEGGAGWSGVTDWYGESESERNEFVGNTITGAWKYACMLHCGREMVKIEGYFTNKYTTGYALAMFSEAEKLLIAGSLVEVTSPHLGYLARKPNGDLWPANGSPTKTWISKSHFFARVNKGDGLLYIQGACSNTSLHAVEFRSMGEPCVAIYGDVGHGYIFDGVSARVGFDAPTSGADSGCAFFAAVSDAAKISRVRVRGEFKLRHDTSGTPGHFVDWTTGSSGSFPDITGDIYIPSGMGYGLKSASRGIDNWRVRGAGAVDNSYIQAGDNELESSTARVQLAGTGVRLKGVGAKTITVSGANGLHYTSGAAKCLAEDLLITTTTSGTAALIEGDGNMVRAVEVTSSINDGFTLRGDKNVLENCTVLAAGGSYYAIRFDPNSATNNGGYNTVIGGRYVGNVIFEAGTGGGANAQYNKIVGALIEGNVTFEAGTDNNKLIGCTVTGTVTNNGGVGNTVS